MYFFNKTELNARNSCNILAEIGLEERFTCIFSVETRSETRCTCISVILKIFRLEIHVFPRLSGDLGL